MEHKSILICEYCGEIINQDNLFVHKIIKTKDEISHEDYYHQECFINSIIKDLEKEKQDYQEKKEKAIAELYDKDGKQKREEKKKAIETRKNK